MNRIEIRSVLGDAREAEVFEGAGHPWVNCPFCGSAVYLGDPHPDHQNSCVSRNGRCANPWCLANPAMPLDEARRIRGEAILREMAEAERAAIHRATMARLREDQEARQAAWREIRNLAAERGCCLECAWRAFDRLGKRRLVRHRGECPVLKSRSQK